jgi:hypothetical protein
VLRPNHSQVVYLSTKPFQRPPAAVADLMKTLLGAFIWPTLSRASIYRARPCRADRCRRMDRALRRRAPGSPARTGSHSPESRKRGLSMTRCSWESTSHATKFSRTITTGSSSKRCSCASVSNVSRQCQQRGAGKHRPDRIHRSYPRTDHRPQSSSASLHCSASRFSSSARLSGEKLPETGCPTYF